MSYRMELLHVVVDYVRVFNIFLNKRSGMDTAYSKQCLHSFIHEASTVRP